MSYQLDVKGKTINQIARWYFEDELYVNRKYQRKLVWSLEEKKLFIDSLMSQFPTPSIMLNSVSENGENGLTYHRYEIVDGMQRLDAILSFITGEFELEYAKGATGYFDISAMPIAQKLVENQQIVQHEPKIPVELCLDFADTEVPVIISQQSEEKIAEIFCRINSSGRKLSLQDLRQASVVDDFSELVRRCAIRIRGDYTYTDCINLCDMRKISISGRGLNYGINHHDIFWRRHNIIIYDNLRSSRDEEIIAALLTNILLKKTGRVNSNLLDKMYDQDSEENKEAIKVIKCIGRENIEEAFDSVRATIDNIFYHVNSTYSNYLFSTRKVSGKDDIFQIIFLALYQLQREKYQICDYEEVANTLKESTGSIFLKIIEGKKTDANDINFMYQSIYSLLKGKMRMKKNRESTAIEQDIMHRLSLSDIEMSMTEFKIGILEFESHEINHACIEKIARTLVAMANSPVEEEGFVIIGIANEEKAAKKWENTYGKMATIYGQHFVVGIEAEALSRYHDIDVYMQAVKDLIKAQPISEPLKQYVLSNLLIINFEDVKLLLIKSKRQDSQSTYNGEICVRNGNSTESMRR